jgi:glycosyltransferase involved in cell wall biosynthesis
MSARIATVVHGRFYAFDLVRELCRLGSDATLLTNYPAWAAARFGVPAHAVRSNTFNGVLTRVLQKTGLLNLTAFEALLHTMFGKWAARQLARENCDVVQCFSGVAEEVFSDPRNAGKLKLLIRASTHIETQRALLLDEERRAGVAVSKPSEWMVAREMREYALADRIVVLSTFCRDSFVRHGVDPQRLWLLPLGVEVSKFRSTPEEAQSRAKRIVHGGKLRVLTTGAFLLRKGAFDYVQIVEQSAGAFEFRWVGPVPREAEHLRRRLEGKVSFVPKVPQYALKYHYDWADLYMYPTIEDGFPVVFSQAQAAGLPILATPNSSAPDIVQEGETGWIVPARAAAAFVERLRWCDQSRKELAKLAEISYARRKPDDWSAVAAQFRALLMTQGLKRGQ